MSALRTLGYLTEDLDPEYISETEMNSILFAVLTNIDENQVELSQIAASAFARAAPFTGKNF